MSFLLIYVRFDMKTKWLLILFIFLSVSPFYGLETGQQALGKTYFEIISGFTGDTVFHMAARYTYRASAKTEIGWGLNYYKLEDTEQSLQGKYLALGPVFRHNVRIIKGFGLLFSLDLFGAVYTELTSTPEATDKSVFTAEIKPELLFYQRIKLSKNVSLFPAAGVCAVLSYYKVEKEKKEGQEEAEGYERGIIEARVVVKLPMIFRSSGKKYILIEPAYKHHVYSSKFEKMETFTVKIGFSW